MNKLVPVGAFIFGCAVGAAGTYKYFEKKFSDISEKEIESVKQAFKRTYIDRVASDNDKEIVVSIASEDQKEVIKNDADKRNPSLEQAYADMNRAKEIADREGYTSYSSYSKKKKNKKEVKEAEELAPYVIEPQEFDMEDYTLMSLTYYADGVLANEENEVITDVDAVIGEDSLNHFGEYEDDAIYVRDDRKRIDYEILMSDFTYTEAVENGPRRVSLEE